MWSPAAVDALVFFHTNAVWQAQTASGPSVRKADFPLRSRTSGPRHSMLYVLLRIRLTRLEMTDPHIDRSTLPYDPRLDFQVIHLIALNIAWVNKSSLIRNPIDRCCLQSTMPGSDFKECSMPMGEMRYEIANYATGSVRESNRRDARYRHRFQR